MAFTSCNACRWRRRTTGYRQSRLLTGEKSDMLDLHSTLRLSAPLIPPVEGIRANGIRIYWEGFAHGPPRGIILWDRWQDSAGVHHRCAGNLPASRFTYSAAGGGRSWHSPLKPGCQTATKETCRSSKRDSYAVRVRRHELVGRAPVGSGTTNKTTAGWRRPRSDNTGLTFFAA